MLANSRVQATAVNSPPLIPTLENKGKHHLARAKMPLFSLECGERRQLSPLAPLFLKVFKMESNLEVEGRNKKGESCRNPSSVGSG